MVHQTVEVMINGTRAKVLVKGFMPVFYPNLYATNELSRRALNTQKKYLDHIGLFEDFLEYESIDLITRLEQRPVPAKNLKWIGRPEGLLLRAITVTKPEFIDIRTLHLALKRLSLSGTQAKLVIQKLKRADLLPGWLQKLEAFEL